MSLSKLIYNSYELVTPQGKMTLCTNEVSCKLCKRVCKSKQAFYNHTMNNGCAGECDLLCFCGKELSHHHCKMLGTVRCAFCGFQFKNLEAGMNHCMNAHKDGNYWNISKFLVYDDLSFVNEKFNSIPEAQCFECKKHWNYGQFAQWWKTGDSARKRMLTRKVLSTEHHECEILELISIRGKLICWYKKPQRHNLRIFDINTKIGKLQVHFD